MKKNSYKFYYFFSNLAIFLGQIVFRGKCYGIENIPKIGGCILAGNHTCNYDAYLLLKSTKRPIHFIAKKELFDSAFGWIFKKMHLIPVDRSKKNPESKQIAIDLLKNGEIIGIFPEGTFHDKDSKIKKEILLPFKPGAVSFSLKSGAPIIPFAIVGKFKIWSKPKIVFGKPIYIEKIQDDKIQYLENVVKDLIIKNKTL